MSDIADKRKETRLWVKKQKVLGIDNKIIEQELSRSGWTQEQIKEILYPNQIIKILKIMLWLIISVPLLYFAWGIYVIATWTYGDMKQAKDSKISETRYLNIPIEITSEKIKPVNMVGKRPGLPKGIEVTATATLPISGTYRFVCNLFEEPETGKYRPIRYKPLTEYVAMYLSAVPIDLEMSAGVQEMKYVISIPRVNPSPVKITTAYPQTNYDSISLDGPYQVVCEVSGIRSEVDGKKEGWATFLDKPRTTLEYLDWRGYAIEMPSALIPNYNYYPNVTEKFQTKAYKLSDFTEVSE